MSLQWFLSTQTCVNLFWLQLWEQCQASAVQCSVVSQGWGAEPWIMARIDWSSSRSSPTLLYSTAALYCTLLYSTVLYCTLFVLYYSSMLSKIGTIVMLAVGWWQLGEEALIMILTSYTHDTPILHSWYTHIMLMVVPSDTHNTLILAPLSSASPTLSVSYLLHWAKGK